LYAIGAGGWLALSVLHARGPTQNASVAELAYRMLEAKFLAENARSVGQRTTLVALKSTHAPNSARENLWVFDAAVIDSVRASWERDRARPLPSDALKLLNAELTSSGQL
jgi:hypothetical protein